MLGETNARQATAEEIQSHARAGGLALDEKRAEALVPVCAALAEADRRLRTLPMADSAAAGPPWGQAGLDD